MAGRPKWLRIVNVNLRNMLVDRFRPNGDDMQAVTVWEPPPLLSKLTNQTIQRILDQIGEGYDGPGRLYSGAPQATQRGAWKVIQNCSSEIGRSRRRRLSGCGSRTAC